MYIGGEYNGYEGMIQRSGYNIHPRRQIVCILFWHWNDFPLFVWILWKLDELWIYGAMDKSKCIAGNRQWN